VIQGNDNGTSANAVEVFESDNVRLLVRGRDFTLCIVCGAQKVSSPLPQRFRVLQDCKETSYLQRDGRVVVVVLRRRERTGGTSAREG
jgi:hypothetical protein